jgi:hypothetical protein
MSWPDLTRAPLRPIQHRRVHLYPVVLSVRVYLESCVQRLVLFGILGTRLSVELAHSALVAVRGAHVFISSTLMALFASLGTYRALVAAQMRRTLETVARVQHATAGRTRSGRAIRDKRRRRL